MWVAHLFGLAIGELRHDDGPLPREVGPERIVAVAEERAVWPRLIGRTAVRTESPRQADVSWKRWRAFASASRVEIVHDRTHERPLLGRARHRLQRDAVSRHSRHHVGTAVNRVFMRHRPHDSQSIRDAGDLRQPFADLQTGDGRVDGFHLTLNLSRGERLGIERLMLRRRPEQKDEDARLGSGR